MNRYNKYLMSTGIAMAAAILLLVAVAHVSISVRAKERAASKLDRVDSIEEQIMKKVSPGMMDIPWKKVVSFFK